MIKWFCIILVCIPRILYSTIVLFFMNKRKDKYDLSRRYKIVRNTVKCISVMTRRRMNVINKEIIQNEHKQGRVYVSNHLNVYDAVSLIELSDKPLIFISKKENLKVPFLMTHAIAVDTLFIDRNDLRQSLRICKEAANLVKQGYDVVLFAEGTRSKDGNIGSFKGALGALVQYAEAEQVLITMHNTTNPLKWRWITYPRERVNLRFFEPLPYSFFLENRKEYTNLTREMIVKQYEEFKKGCNN